MDAVRSFDPEVVVGVPRSGMLPATILALGLVRPLADVSSAASRRAWRAGGDGETIPCGARRILLVDDSSCTGTAMKRARCALFDARPEAEIVTCSVYSTEKAAGRIDLSFEVCGKNRMFEWNWFRHPLLTECCVDIDGVLCRDPTRTERKDEKLYLKFLETTVPSILPTEKIGALVTGRRERYRGQTERWLKQHGIAFGALHMLDASDEAQTVERHASHKAAIYKKSAARLFIESDEEQAKLIAKSTGKDVLCWTTRTLF
jgi:uncharacterized HAD superfamily protein